MITIVYTDGSTSELRDKYNFEIKEGCFHLSSENNDVWLPYSAITAIKVDK